MLAEREFSLPVGWYATRLREFTTESKDRAGPEHDLPVYSVTKHRGIVRSEAFFKKAVYSRDTSKYKVVRPGQFAYATIHLNEGSIGRLGTPQPGVVSPMYTVFDTNERLNPAYLLAVLKSQHSLRVFEGITQGTVNRRGGISFKALSDLVLHHPPLSEQRKIADILSSVDQTIEKAQAVIDQVRLVKRGLLNDLLTRGLPGQHTRFKPTRIGEIPWGWDEALLGDRAELQTGFPFKSRDFSADGDRLLRGSNVGPGHLIWRKDRTRFFPSSRRAEVKEYVLREGDVVVAMDRPFIGGGFKVATLTASDLPSLLLQRVGRFRNYRNLAPEYLWHLLQSRYVKTHLLVNQKGTDLPHISKAEIESSICPFPPMAEQERISDVLGTLDSYTAQLERERKQTHRVKSALMSVLLTGELRVTPDPEPE